MKTATIFGSLSDNDNNLESTFNILLGDNIGHIFIGGYNGQLKNFVDKCKENNIEVTLIITQKGKDMGYGSSGNTKEITAESYFGKKDLLYSSSDLFIFLPTQRIGLGLFSEIVDLLDYSVNYCNIIKQEPPIMVFMGQTYKTVVEDILTRTNNNYKNIKYVD